MQGVLFINNKDAFIAWGIIMSSTSLSALMTPPALKEWITNEVRTEDGTRYLQSSTPTMAARDINITFTMIADDEEQFFTRYNSFCEELAGGIIEIRTKYQSCTYRCIYKSCSQFTEFAKGIATFGLQLTEPNPNNR